MALKKSELYSSLWSSCDELRGGMDASQYKDYVLVLLFIKYVSDKYAGQPYAPITIPPGASFKDMVALKGKPDIGDQIHETVRRVKPDDFRGHQARENTIKAALLPLLKNDQAEVERIFLIVKAQREY
jgi:type I restriction-modification system DNA methylase subunit